MSQKISINPSKRPSGLAVGSAVLFMLGLLAWHGSTAAARVQQIDENVEVWRGVLGVSNINLNIEMHFARQGNGSCTAKMISIDQGGIEIPCDSATLTDTEMEFEIASVQATFKGNREGPVVTGTFTQFGAATPFELKLEGHIAEPVHVETWQGLLVAGAQKFDLQFRIFSDADNNFTVRHDSIGEKVGGIPAELIHEGDTVTLKIPVTRAVFEGTMAADGNSIEGLWKQGAGEYPMTINKVALEETKDWMVKRPQTPQPPFDYESLDLKLENKAAGVTLGGTLTAPRGAGPFPLVILITGSGAQDRDETIFEHRPFLVIADHLARNGIACFRYDDRGVGDSTGDFATATSVDFATDVDAVIDFLKSQPLVDPARICLMGHSEGGIIAPMVASRRDDVAAIVLLAGTGVDGKQIALNQSELIARASGAAEELVDLQNMMLNRLFARQEAGGDYDDAFIAGLAEEIKAAIPEGEVAGVNVTQLLKDTAVKFDSPWFKFFSSYDPAEALSKTRCPVYAVVGSKDLQVDPKLNMPAIEAALKAGGNTQYKMEIFPGLNHLFQTCDTGSITEYNRIEETFSPLALDKITAWVKETLAQ